MGAQASDTRSATGLASVFAWLCVAATIALGVYGQVVIKWQLTRHGHLPKAFGSKIHYFAHFLLNPWVVSALGGAVIAAFAWMAALSRLPLSQAYPFIGLSFVLVLFLSAIFFGETVTLPKVAGVVLIVGGIAIASVL